MTTDELEQLARQWAHGQRERWAYPRDSDKWKEVQALIQDAQQKIEGLGYQITTDDWGNVVVQMPFKV